MEKIDKADRDNFDILMSDMAFNMHPELLKDGFSVSQNSNTEELNKYFSMLTSISKALKKIKKYPVIFSEFYPTTVSITPEEALEHHIHAYLEDLDILKEKMVTFLGCLKNDLKKFATNKRDIVKALDFTVNQVHKVFEGTSKHRRPHHHHGPQFIDPDLIKTQAMSMVYANGSQYLSKEGLDIVKQKGQESFEKSKVRWIATAKRNDEQTSGLVDEVFKRINSFIYQYLNIETMFK